MLIVECHELGRRFGAAVAVEGLSFSVAEGELFAFLGPNGAGKTTTLHMLTTMLEPTSGWARVAGFDVVRQAPAVRESIGVVFQEPALDERLNARENLEIHAVLYGLRGPRLKEAIAQALEWASLAEVAHRPVRTFSGGMKRRLELARALMHTPKILFLDEPTLGLDPQGRRHLWERIATLRGQGLTVFMTTHYLQEAEACDRVGIIDQGHLIALDTPAALKLKVLGKAEGSLEEVFLELTGRKLRDEEARPRDRLLGFARRGGEHTR
ncbi:ABC transporter ATP-binding protein [Calidithermus roseus]|uniref:Putative ABC transporter ATP-binding protein YbhF n=1 Tax=Calidithermus roseus TaxID=1644118 RepID=A0A399EWS8_9DEIN|nr:ATP-binding cassette domain-containing protein [Calidithermus roseus]RIH87549.1 putative ABC transporter ATP-binding protein YbhF [Calidithermus roseus]